MKKIIVGIINAPIRWLFWIFDKYATDPIENATTLIRSPIGLEIIRTSERMKSIVIIEIFM